MAITDTAALQKTFLDLPAEVRNTIYELALEKQTIVFPKTGEAQYPGLVMVCKQVHQDTELMRYADCIFHFESVGKLASWLRNVDVQKRALVRNIIVDSEIEHRLWRENNTMAGVIVHGGLIDRFKGIERRFRNAGLALQPGCLTLQATCWSDVDDVAGTWLSFSCHRDTEGLERVQKM